MSFLSTDAINAIAATASAVAAGAALYATKRANNTADTVARIERDRWHADLTPDFGIRVEQAEGGSDRYTLIVDLVGPTALHHLDSIAIAVDNDDDDRTMRGGLIVGGATQEEIDAHIWGPLRFAEDVDGVDAHGRTVDPVSMQVGRGRAFALQRTKPGYWEQGDGVNEAWERKWRTKPLRLILTCNNAEHTQWVIPERVEDWEGPVRD
jgi:hypothetical protein